VTSQTRLAHTAGFLHLGQSCRRAAAVNIPGSRTCRPGLTAASTGTPSKAEEPRHNHKINNLLHRYLDKLIGCAMAHRANKIAYALVRDQSGYDPDRWA
jgi:hypothetical protein